MKSFQTNDREIPSSNTNESLHNLINKSVESQYLKSDCDIRNVNN